MVVGPLWLRGRWQIILVDWWSRGWDWRMLSFFECKWDSCWTLFHTCVSYRPSAMMLIWILLQRSESKRFLFSWPPPWVFWSDRISSSFLVRSCLSDRICDDRPYLGDTGPLRLPKWRFWCCILLFFRDYWQNEFHSTRPGQGCPQSELSFVLRKSMLEELSLTFEFIF